MRFTFTYEEDVTAELEVTFDKSDFAKMMDGLRGDPRFRTPLGRVIASGWLQYRSVSLVDLITKIPINALHVTVHDYSQCYPIHYGFHCNPRIVGNRRQLITSDASDLNENNEILL